MRSRPRPYARLSLPRARARARYVNSENQDDEWYARPPFPAVHTHTYDFLLLSQSSTPNYGRTHDDARDFHGERHARRHGRQVQHGLPGLTQSSSASGNERWARGGTRSFFGVARVEELMPA
jgi:hypothetical protein